MDDVVGKLVQLDSYRYPWREVMTADGAASSLQVYVNPRTKEIEIVQSNDGGDVIRTVLTPQDVELLRFVITNFSAAQKR